jgi:hypothetical protein
VEIAMRKLQNVEKGTQGALENTESARQTSRPIRESKRKGHLVQAVVRGNSGGGQKRKSERMHR